jgi:hypothetical protein
MAATPDSSHLIACTSLGAITQIDITAKKKLHSLTDKLAVGP